MKNIKKLMLVAAIGTFIVQDAIAGAAVGATEFTQIANNAQLVAAYGEQAQQTVHQFNMYQAMLKNLQQSVPSALLDQQALNLWNNSNMTQAFQNLQSIVQNGQRVSYTMSTQDQTFKRLHPGYGTQFNPSAYRDWSDDSHAAVQNALSVAGVQSNSIQSEQDMVRELQSRSQSATGQMAMLKAGNDIGVSMIGQMQQLRQLQIAQMTAQSHYMEGQTSQQDQKKSGTAIIFGNIHSSRLVEGTKTVPAGSTQ
jgi:P-type conjugative transfer protein TrbJ